MQDAAVVSAPEFVSIELGSLRGEQESDRGTRYTVDLSGRVDGRWLRTFRGLQQSADLYSRYRLEADGRSISFRTGAGEGSEQVIVLIERLVELVRSVEGATGAP